MVYICIQSNKVLSAIRRVKKEVLIIILFKFIYYTIKDLFNKDKKDISGIYVYCGLFGCGKTLSLVRDLKKLKDDGYNVYTNFSCVFQDGKIVSWRDMLSVPANSVLAIDEASFIFNNKEWKNMPKELFGYIVQQRKKNIRMCFTAQDFSEVDKSIRDKAKYVIDCKRLGRLIINRYYTTAQFNRAVNARKREFTVRFVREDCFSEWYNTNEVVKMLKGAKIEN